MFAWLPLLLGADRSLIVSREQLPESELRLRSGVQLSFTLVSDSWASGIGEQRAVTVAWLDTLRADASDEPLGWNAVAVPSLGAISLLRSSESTLTLQLGWLPEFDIAQPELVAVHAPWWATASNQSASRANFTIAPSDPILRPSGELASGVVAESQLRSRAHTLRLHLDGCDWAIDAGTRGSAAYVALASALVSTRLAQASAGRSGWQLAGTGRLQVQRINASEVLLTVPPLPAYDVDSPETVEVTVPAEALLQARSSPSQPSSPARQFPKRLLLHASVRLRAFCCFVRRTPPHKQSVWFTPRERSAHTCLASAASRPSAPRLELRHHGRARPGAPAWRPARTQQQLP